MTAPISRIPPSPGPGHSVHSVHHSGRAGLGDASGEVTSPYCTPPGTQLLVSIDTTCTPWNFPMVLSILTPTCSIVAVVSRTVVVSPICPRHQDDGVTPLVDTGQWWHHGPNPGPGLSPTVGESVSIISIFQSVLSGGPIPSTGHTNLGHNQGASTAFSGSH